MMATAVAPPRASAPPATQRQASVDFAKGALVVLMVVYHWLNYFVGVYGDYYSFLRFLTPSFIFITGYLISNALVAKYGAGNWVLYRRLLERGAKLLVIFTLLNICANLLGGRNYTGLQFGISAFTSNLYSIYVEGTGRDAIFDVLVPISYLLLVAPLLLLVSGWLRAPLWLPAIVGFSVILVMALNGLPNANVELMGFGFLGLGIGSLPSARISRTLDRTVALALIYAAQCIAIAIWDIAYWVLAISVCANLWLLYWLGKRLTSPAAVVSIVGELGQYTLFAYIFHIFVLQVLRRILHVSSPWGTALPFVLTLLATVGAIKLLQYARGRVGAIDRCYRFAFA